MLKKTGKNIILFFVVVLYMGEYKFRLKAAKRLSNDSENFVLF